MKWQKNSLQRRKSPTNAPKARIHCHSRDQWLIKKCSRNEYQRWKRNYEGVYNKYVSVQPGSKKPVKIAVLDTGLDLSHPDIVAREESIKERYNWMDSRNIDNVQDSSGHGTHTTGLLLDYAPDAELYVAKIAESDPSDPRTIAAVSLE